MRFDVEPVIEISLVFDLDATVAVGDPVKELGELQFGLFAIFEIEIEARFAPIWTDVPQDATAGSLPHCVQPVRLLRLESSIRSASVNSGYIVSRRS